MAERTREWDAVQAYQWHRDRAAAEKELEEKRWTLDEVAQLQEDARTDAVNGPRRYEALRPHIEESNLRGDFKYPWQMTRAEFAEYAGANGSPVLSMVDIRDLMNGLQTGPDSELITTLTRFADTARKSGRLMQGPSDGKSMNDPNRYRTFADDTPESRAELVENIRTQARQFAGVRKLLGEMVAQLTRLAESGAETPERESYAHRQLDKIEGELAGITYFSVEGLPEYKALQQAAAVE